MNLQPPSICVFVSGDSHLVHMRDGLCFLLHVWMCTPHATSNESLLARKGDVEYAWIVWSKPLVLASFRIYLSIDCAMTCHGAGCVCSDDFA